MGEKEKINKKKILFSLLVAAAFLLSSASAVVGFTVEKQDAGEITNITETTNCGSCDQNTVQTISSSGAVFGNNVPSIARDSVTPMDDDGCYPIQVTNIKVGDHLLPAIVSTGTYPLSIEVCRPEYCTEAVDSFIDHDQELYDLGGNPRNLQPLTIDTYCDVDIVTITFTNDAMNAANPAVRERPIGEVRIRLRGDLGNRWYSTDLGDGSGGTVVYWGANPIPGSTVVRTGGYPSTDPSVVVMTIPREDPTSGDKYWAGCCDEIEWRYYVQCTQGAWNPNPDLNENRAPGWLEDFCDCDMYPAEMKKFVEVYKWHDPVEDPPEEVDLFCEDFEDPCQIVDLWETVNVINPGDTSGTIDTWVVTDKRYYSEGHSMHNTMFDEYLPLAEDYLIFHNGTTGLDVSGFDEVVVSFWHWMEADIVDSHIVDYGWVEYSDTGAFAGEEVFLGGLYYDNDWIQEEFAIDLDPVNPADDALYLRFGFISDPAFCYEGWYIDDVCFTGITEGSTVDGWWEFIHDSHSWPQVLEDECEWYTFPDKWTVEEEGEYQVCAWLEALDPCHYSMDTYPGWDFSGDLCLPVEIGNIEEYELDCGTFALSPGSTVMEGTDIDMSIDACNIGTLDGEDVQVKFTVNRGAMDTAFTDDVESGPYPNSTYRLVTAYPEADLWHITDFDAYSGTYAWMWSNPDHISYPPDCGSDSSYPPFGYHNAPIAIGDIEYSTSDYQLNPTLYMNAKWAFAPEDFFGLGIHDPSEEAFVRYGYNTGMATPTQTDFKGGIQTSWTRINFEYAGLLQALIGFAGITDGDLRLAIGVYTTPASPGTSGEAFSGIIFDDTEIIQIVSEPTVIFTDTFNIEDLPIMTCETASTTWENAGVGQYLVTAEILNSDADPNNNKCITPLNVINVICDIYDECEPPCGTIEFKDLTGEGPGHWKIAGCCPEYIWIGDEATGAYGNNWDDSLYLLDPVDGDRTFDCSAYTDIFWEFDYQCSFNTSNDLLWVEASDDDGVTFWPLAIVTGNNPSYPLFDHAIIDVDLVLGFVGAGITSTMQYRFRFESNDTGVDRGIFLDNIWVHNDDIFGPDDCTSMDNFESTETAYGNWWRTPHQDYFAWGASNLPGVLPQETYGCYDPLAWTMLRPWNAFYPDNINNALDWTIDTQGAFLGWIETTPLWNMGPGDSGFIEISSDGVNFDELDNFPYGGYYWAPYSSYMITDYLTTPETTIRFRVESDAYNPGWKYGFYFEELTFVGMVDSNAPVTVCELVGDYDATYQWYTEKVAVYLTATDDVTGVKATYYQIDGGAVQTYTGPFLVEGDGEHEVCYWSVDNEDNTEVKKCTGKFRLDTTGPSVTITGPEPGIYLMGKKLLTSEKYIFLFGGVPITAAVTIDDAPLDTVEFYLDGVLFAEDTTAPYEAMCTEKHTGAAEFKVVAKDVLGRTDDATLNVDNYLKLF